MGPGTHRAPRAGDRLPDAPLVIDGHATSLHELTAPPGWHVLHCGIESPPPPVGAVAVHRLDGPGHEQALRRLRVRPRDSTVLLVRPDGYIGYRGSTAGLQSYLDRWLPDD